jgi:hypothetical protein
MSMPLIPASSEAGLLYLQPAADLDLTLVVARGAVGVGDVSECRSSCAGASAQIREMGGVGVGGVVIDDVSNWINRSYILMIEDVEGFAQHFECDAIGEICPFREAYIEVGDGRIAEGIATDLRNEIVSSVAVKACAETTDARAGRALLSRLGVKKYSHAAMTASELV